MCRELTTLQFGMDAAFGRETLSGTATVSGHEVVGVADGFDGVGKALLYAQAALQDLLARQPLSETQLAETGICINLSDYHAQDLAFTELFVSQSGERPLKSELPSTKWQHQCANLIDRLQDITGSRFSPRARQLVFGGHAGFVEAISVAQQWVDAGVVGRCLVGAVDSRTDVTFLQAAAQLGVLRTNEHPAGLIPGEAAVLCLLEAPTLARSEGNDHNTRVTHASQRRERANLLSTDPAAGRALTEAIGDVLGGHPAPCWIIGDLNGTTKRATEWGHALVRLHHQLKLDPDCCWFPAEHFGDTGAAAGALALGTAAQAWKRGYAPRPQSLIWSSSEGGTKSALLVQRQS